MRNAVYRQNSKFFLMVIVIQPHSSFQLPSVVMDERHEKAGGEIFTGIMEDGQTNPIARRKRTEVTGFAGGAVDIVVGGVAVGTIDQSYETDDTVIMGSEISMQNNGDKPVAYWCCQPMEAGANATVLSMARLRVLAGETITLVAGKEYVVCGGLLEAEDGTQHKLGSFFELETDIVLTAKKNTVFAVFVR